MKAAHFHPKQLVRLNFRNQQEARSSEKLFSQNNKLLSIKSWGTKKTFNKLVMWTYSPELQTGRFYVYIYIYQIMKNQGPGPCNALLHTDNWEYVFGLSLTWNRREAHMIRFLRKAWKIWICSFWEKGNFILISEFKYWTNLKNISLYITFNGDG